MSIMDEIRKQKINNINEEHPSLVSLPRDITHAKRGDRVIFRGGFYLIKDEYLPVGSSSSFIVGREYVCRQDYNDNAYDKTFDVNKVNFTGSISVVEDSQGSKQNGWAAAYFELI